MNKKIIKLLKDYENINNVIEINNLKKNKIIKIETFIIYDNKKINLTYKENVLKIIFYENEKYFLYNKKYKSKKQILNILKNKEMINKNLLNYLK